MSDPLSEQHATSCNTIARPRVFSLPPEILSTIFVFGQGMDQNSAAGIISNDPPFELVISQVCSHFRCVALLARALWRWIQISDQISPHRVALYLQRSGTCSLDVRIDLGDTGLHSNLSMKEMFDAALLFSPRWRSFSIKTSQQTITHPIIVALCNVSFPLLQRLSIIVEDIQRHPVSAGNHQLAPRALPVSPTLISLRLRGLAIHLFRPPLCALTTLHIDQTKAIPIRQSIFVSIITASPALKNLSIYGDIMDTGSWEGDQEIQVNDLRSLRICGIDGSVFSGLLLCIVAPRLRSLTLKDVQEHDLDRFIRLSNPARFPRLCALVFSGFNLSEVAYQDLFLAFPTITSFTSINSPFETATLLRLLSIRIPNPIGAPEMWWKTLRVLAFLRCDDETLIQRVIASRQRYGFPIQKLRIGSSQELIGLPRHTWLNRNVELHSFSDIDSWPSSMNEVDLDDVLFN